MLVQRFHTTIVSAEKGGEAIKKLITNVEKAKKSMKYYHATSVKIDLIGVLYTRTINLDKVENIKVVKDKLKISFSAVIRDESMSLKDKDTTITIPLKMIDSIETEVRSYF